MIATLTSKGQITLPKGIRDQLGLLSGARLDFVALADGSIIAKLVKVNPMSARGILKSPHARPLTLEDVDEAVGRHLRDARSAGKRA